MIDGCQAGAYVEIMAKRVSDVLKHAILRAPSRYAISKATGVEQSALSRFVRGHRSLSLDAVDAIAQHLGLELKSIRRMKVGGR
jgi:hypothetical protein